MKRQRLTRAMALAILLSACRSRDTPAPEASASPDSDPGPATAAQAEPGAGGHDPGLVSGYQVSTEELRRATFLKTAVLIHPAGADDAMAALFGETGVRFGRLEAAERFGQYS